LYSPPPCSGAFRVVIAGGGTGGHVFPALALADALHRLGPEVETLFIGSVGGLEQQLVPRHGHRLELLRIDKLRGVGLLSRLVALGRLPLATSRAAWLLRRFRPHVVVGLGGYASAPVVLAASLIMRLPVVLLEQNAIPGTVNRALARLSQAVVTAFREAARHLPEDRALLLGNPIRPSLLAALEGPCRPGTSQQSDSLSALARAGTKGPSLLVLGGSQGAHAVNELMIEAVPRLVERIPALRIRHQTGSADLERVKAAYRAAAVPAVVEAFIEEMGAAYQEASLVVGRSGATTLAELCAAGKPAVLIPYPYAADDHQAKNALEIAEEGGALMRRQSELDPETLAALLAELLQDNDRLERMARAMRRCGRPRAADVIAAMLRERFG
jgi:UDP-N-acetylglucosamine--N-acetylmuramyl-(pentapeptide) pyrophosphoryl-undecaprenol N-acetylglucosamine transferase